MERSCRMFFCVTLDPTVGDSDRSVLIFSSRDAAYHVLKEFRASQSKLEKLSGAKRELLSFGWTLLDGKKLVSGLPHKDTTLVAVNLPKWMNRIHLLEALGDSVTDKLESIVDSCSRFQPEAAEIPLSLDEIPDFFKKDIPLNWDEETLGYWNPLKLIRAYKRSTRTTFVYQLTPARGSLSRTDSLVALDHFHNPQANILLRNAYGTYHTETYLEHQSPCFDVIPEITENPLTDLLMRVEKSGNTATLVTQYKCYELCNNRALDAKKNEIQQMFEDSLDETRQISTELPPIITKKVGCD